LPWKRLFEPSIRLSRGGWKINENFAKKIKAHEEEILARPMLKKILAPNGRLVELGETISRPMYAQTLQEVAENGTEVFYNGWIAKSLVETVQGDGGILTLDDFINYRTVTELPLVGSYRGMDIYTAPPPASGTVLLSALNILENFNDFKELTPQNAHRMIEAYKFAYAQRGFLGDPIDVIYF
jgi:gamma-glutamyltranspeptidase